MRFPFRTPLPQLSLYQNIFNRVCCDRLIRADCSLTNTPETPGVIDKTDTKGMCRALRQIRHDFNRSNFYLSLSDSETLVKRAIKYLSRSCGFGRPQAMTYIPNNDTPALNASLHWAAGREPCRGEIPVEPQPAAVRFCRKIIMIMKGYVIMSNIRFMERSAIEKNTLQSKYEVGNSVYIVNSHFAGKERLEDLIFNILHKKSVVNNAENISKA